LATIRLQRREPESLIIQLLAQISGERGDLFVGQIVGHPCEMVRLTVERKAVAHSPA
jgi:hypothetical protein